MKTNSLASLPSLLLGAALALGLAAPAVASDDPGAAAAPVPALNRGLLGQNYVNLGYHYTDLTDTSVNAHAFDFALNEAVHDGYDTLLEYRYDRSENTGLGHATQQQLDAGVRFYTSFQGWKPYAEAGLGWLWQKAPVVGHDNSFLWFAGVGAEYQLAPDLTFTPLLRYTHAASLTPHEEWNYGVKANYWLTERIGVQATILRDNTRDMSYGLGLNYRF